MHIKNQKKGFKENRLTEVFLLWYQCWLLKCFKKSSIFITKVWFLSFIVVQSEKSSIFSYLLFSPSDFNFYYVFKEKYHFILHFVKICNKKWEFFFIIFAISNASLCWLFISFVIINHHKKTFSLLFNFIPFILMYMLEAQDE